MSVGPRSVFVANIPYDTTEERLTEIFAEVGPVVSLRLAFDRETGKPRGFGFCEFRDHETAMSAARNLNGYDINGRQIRVDMADHDKDAKVGGGAASGSGAGGAGRGGTDFRSSNSSSGGGRSGGGNSGSGRMGTAGSTAGTNNGGSGVSGGNSGPSRHTGEVAASGPIPDFQTPVSGPPVDAQLSPEVIASTVNGMTGAQMLDVMAHLKAMLLQYPDQARDLLRANPQLTYAVLQMQLRMRMVDPVVAGKLVIAADHLATTAAATPPIVPAQQPPPIHMSTQQIGGPAPLLQQPQPTQYSQQSVPMQQQQSQPQPQPPAVAAGPDTTALMMQVLNLSQAQIDSLPEAQRAQIMHLRKIAGGMGQ